MSNKELHRELENIFDKYCSKKITKEDYLRAKEIIKEYFKRNGLGCITFIAGMDTEKNDMYSMANLMNLNVYQLVLEPIGQVTDQRR